MSLATSVSRFIRRGTIKLFAIYFGIHSKMSKPRPREELIDYADMFIERMLSHFRSGRILSTPTEKRIVNFDSVQNAIKAFDEVKTLLVLSIDNGHIRTENEVAKYISENFMKYFTPMEVADLNKNKQLKGKQVSQNN